jgi:hypothetical protein
VVAAQLKPRPSRLVHAGTVMVLADSRFVDSAVPFDFAQGLAALGMTKVVGGPALWHD